MHPHRQSKQYFSKQEAPIIFRKSGTPGLLLKKMSLYVHEKHMAASAFLFFSYSFIQVTYHVLFVSWLNPWQMMPEVRVALFGVNPNRKFMD